ncbi:MFS transporter [Silvibacterium dinghuense]|uniref:MFS transporter n=1 Tax=Silvibacterium dinghuense TaxID=1560006 RepID=A0A4Q1SJC5_9BACT|nr:MFS transporter [Silvibacterium dinghuense]RXS97726.1 MFS transporter [Silvibacterium dinghuense]GGH01475.1 MFS transporter [Silvibacterium dinghuense]
MPDHSPDPHPDSDPGRAAAAFLSRDFRLYQIARLLVIIGAEAQSLAVAWQVYQITHKAIDLGYTGLALFLPGLLFILPSGHVADRFDRRAVILVCYGLQIFCTLTLFLFALHGMRSILPIYVVLFLVGTGRSFSGPASSALLPHLVPKEHFVNAVTWGATVFQIANISGPALGGVLFTLPLTHGIVARLAGAPLVFLFTLTTLCCFLVLVGSLSVRPGRMEHRATSMATILAGFHYVRRTPILLGSISLDLFAVLLGGAVSLMPIFAQDILHAGPRGLGLLRGAPALGAMLVSISLTFRPIHRKAGTLMFTCVGIFGAATVLFGVSKSLPLSMAALFVVGASDMVSVVIRSSMLQLGTPPEMRGRVSAVNALFLGASNELGEFESGLTAQWWGAVRAVIFGGIGSMMVTGLWAALFPPLRRVDQLTAQALLQVETEEASKEVRQL